MKKKWDIVHVKSPGLMSNLDTMDVFPPKLEELEDGGWTIFSVDIHSCCIICFKEQHGT